MQNEGLENLEMKSFPSHGGRLIMLIPIDSLNFRVMSIIALKGLELRRQYNKSVIVIEDYEKHAILKHSLMVDW